MLSASALLKGNAVLAGGSQKKATIPKDLAGLTLGTESNPIQCITAWLNELKNKHKTSDLHFIGHGNSDGISLSDQQINCSTLLNNSKLIREWDVERIYLWSCSLGSNTAFLSILESLTGAEVFASKSIVDRDNTRVESNKGNTAYLEQIISSRSLEKWTGNLMAPANSYVTVENGHADNTDPIPADYFSNGERGAPASAGVALLQSTAWWGDAALAQQWADNSNYESPSLNLDGDIGGSIEEVAFVYAFGGYRSDGTTMWSSKRLTDDWGIDNVTRFWSGGFAVASTPLSGITINQTGPKDGSGNLLTTEAGGSSAFTVVLDTNPTDNVTINLSGVSTDSGLVAREYSLSAPTLTFTTANWNTAQTVTVTGGDDDYDDGDRTYTLVATASKTGGYAGTERAITNVKNTDDDTNGVTIAKTGTTDGADLLTTEAGGTSTFTVVLDAKPTANVTVSLTGNDATEGSLDKASLTFTTTNWSTPQTVTVTGVDDDIDDGDTTTTLTATASNTGNYAGTERDTTTVKNRDNNTNGITIAKTGTTDGADLLTTEAGGTSTFTVVLDAKPNANVTVSLTGNDATEGSLDKASLTFTTTNWSTPQTVTVTGVNDDIDDGDITTTLTATASNTGGYAGNEKDTTTVKNRDNNTNGITIAKTGTNDGSGNLLTTEAGGTSTFTVVLDAKPNANVTVSLTGNDATEGSLDKASLTFTTTNWSTPQTVIVTGVDDDIDDGDTTTTLTATANNAGGYAGSETSTVTVKNTDDDTNGVTIAKTGTTDGADLLTTEAGGTSTFTVVLDAKPTANVTVSLTGNDATEGSLDKASLTFTTTNWSTPQTVTVTGVNDDIDDGDTTTTLTATASNTGGYAGNEKDTTTVKNTDDDTNGVTIAKTGTTDGSGNLLTTEAGGTSTFTVVLDAKPTADVTVSNTGKDATENSLSDDSLTFTSDNWSTPQTVTVTGINDDVDDGDITTTLTSTASNTGNYAGTERDSTTVKNTDDDTNGVTIAKTGTTDGADLLTTEAGGTSTFTVVLDAKPTANVTVSNTGNDATEGSLDKASLTFTPDNWSTPKTVTITGVDDDIVDGDIVTTLTSRTSNTGGYVGTETANTSFKNRDNDKDTSNGAGGGGGGGNALSFNKIIKDVTSENNSSNKDIEDDADRDGAIDTYEKGVDPTTGKTFDRNNDGIDDYKQRIVASFAASSGQVASLSSQNPILRTSNSNDQENIESKVALLFRGLTAETEYLDGPSINNLQRSIDSTSGRDPLNTIIRTSDQPDFRLIPEVVVDGSINEAATASYQNDANQIFANKIHRIDYRFEESDINWNALFKPDKTGQLNLLGFDPITGLGGILTDRDGDGRPDGATIFLKDNEKGDLNSNPFVIDDPVGAAELQSSPKLVATSDGRGLTVEGPKDLGLWVRLKTHAADAEWQNSLQLISDQRDEIGGIGATRYSSNLGETEIYLQAGEELYFRQSSNNFSLQESPTFTLEQNTSNKHWILSLDDGGGDPTPDQDYSDLQVSISGHLTPKDMDQYFMARHQTHIHAGVIDLRSQDKEEITLNIDITCDSENVNRLAFIRLDDQDELFSLGGMLPEEGETFQSLARQSLILPNNEQLMFSGNNQATLQWTLESSEFGLYAPVMITQDDVVHMATNNISGSQGNALKLLGQNHFGFEDVLNGDSDWDYNNLTVQVSMI